MNASETHLFAPGRKRLLSLDGGGIRAGLTLAILERLERVVEEVEGRPVRLGDWFDLIGGTSTGSILATLLALGFRVADIRTLYWELGPRIFKRRLAWVLGLNTKFDARVLAREIDRVLAGRTLDSADLRTGLCILMKRLDTGSAWIVANNPRSAFWNDRPDGSPGGNRHLRLGDLVRASTAAPSYFAPEPISLGGGELPGIFIDGALTPHNNPALMMVMMTQLPAYGLGWTARPEELLVVSVGTGSFRPTMTAREARRATSLGLAIRSLAAMVAENERLVLTLLGYFGQSDPRWIINTELGDLADAAPPGGKLFRLARYDAPLEAEWLRRELGEDLPAATVARLRRMDDPSNLDTLYRLGGKAAARQVRADHLRGFRRDEAAP